MPDCDNNLAFKPAMPWEELKEKAKEIRKKLSLSVKEGQIKSEKMNKRREEIKQKYYKHPNYCIICGKMIEYEIGYKHKRCKKCRYKHKGELI